MTKPLNRLFSIFKRKIYLHLTICVKLFSALLVPSFQEKACKIKHAFVSVLSIVYDQFFLKNTYI